MSPRELTQPLVKKHILDGDRVVVSREKSYEPKTPDHQTCWPKIVSAIESGGERGATYSLLRAICGSNKDYIPYLLGQLRVLRCPELERRLAIVDEGELRCSLPAVLNRSQ